MFLRTAILILFIIGVARNIINRLDFVINPLPPDEVDILLHEIQGNVDKENFSFYSLYEEGPIKIVLFSNKGDADLYLASNKKPELYPDNYEFSSATCGVDIIDLPEDLKRPVVIGVYGHPSYESSRFTLSMYINLKEAHHEKKLNKKTISFKEKLNFIVRNTAMWKTFELLEGIFFVL